MVALDEKMLEKAKSAGGFLVSYAVALVRKKCLSETIPHPSLPVFVILPQAALDQSGGSTPKALKAYGVPDDVSRFR